MVLLDLVAAAVPEAVALRVAVEEPVPVEVTVNDGVEFCVATFTRDRVLVEVGVLVGEAEYDGLTLTVALNEVDRVAEAVCELDGVMVCVPVADVPLLPVLLAVGVTDDVKLELLVTDEVADSVLLLLILADAVREAVAVTGDVSVSLTEVDPLADAVAEAECDALPVAVAL